MTKKLLIVGAGQLGRRYLEGALKFDEALDIFIVDPSVDSIASCQSVLDSCQTIHRVHLTNNTEDIPYGIDVAIVATQSAHRLEAIVNARVHGVRYWILEKLLASNLEGLNNLLSTMSGEGKAWVNTPRRISSLYGVLNKEIDKSIPNKLTVTGSKWGLASNSIHFIDLISFLMEDRIEEMCVEISEDSEWVTSQRLGLFELLGKITVTFSNKWSLELISNSDDTPITVNVKSGSETWEIDESSGHISSHHGKKIDDFRLPYQSEMTSGLLREIFDTGSCGLPGIELSANQHRPLLAALEKCWNISGNMASHPLIT
jgi:hypothetical protein